MLYKKIEHYRQKYKFWKGYENLAGFQNIALRPDILKLKSLCQPLGKAIVNNRIYNWNCEKLIQLHKESN